jgi:23S rRNA pseudouridine1911/1915/1917 synthase
VSEERFPVLLPEDMAGWRLDRALAALVPTLSRERVKALISTGQVELDGAPMRDPSAKAKPGMAGFIAIPAPTPAHNEAQDIPLTIVYEDEPDRDRQARGLVVHPAAGNLDGTLVNALLHHCAGQLSGIGGVARPGHRPPDRQGYVRAAGGRQDRRRARRAGQTVRRPFDRAAYLAVVAGLPVPASGTVSGAIGRSTMTARRWPCCMNSTSAASTPSPTYKTLEVHSAAPR